jgi:hypothetical protein
VAAAENDLLAARAAGDRAEAEPDIRRPFIRGVENPGRAHALHVELEREPPDDLALVLLAQGLLADELGRDAALDTVGLDEIVQVEAPTGAVVALPLLPALGDVNDDHVRRCRRCQSVDAVTQGLGKRRRSFLDARLEKRLRAVDPAVVAALR